MTNGDLRKDILLPELSYQIVGSAFEVFNELGPGLRERTYERALAEIFSQRGIKYKEQVYVPVKMKSGTVVGTHLLDFVVENKIVVELKCGNFFSRKEIDQVVGYLTVTKLELAIILQFAKSEVRQKRILNPNLLQT